MPAKDPTDAIQLGVYTLLSADAPLIALADIYDGVPEGAEPDYVVIGEVTAIPDGVHGLEGRQTSFSLHTWTRSEGYAPGNVIAARLVALLWHRHANLDALVAGHKVWRVDHEFAQTIDDPEPGMRHRIDRFRVWSHQEAQ